MPKDPVYGTYIALAEGDVSLSVCLSVSVSICLSVCQCICLSMHLTAVCLSFHLSAVWSVPRDPV